MMTSSVTSPVRTNSVLLPGSCTLKEAVSVRDLLKDGLDATGDVELDARGVERVDTSVVQLLASFVRDMKEAGRAWTWVGTSEEVNRATRLLGLAEMLGVSGDG